MTTGVNARVKPRMTSGRTSRKSAAAARPEAQPAPGFNPKRLTRRLLAAGMTEQQLQGEVLRRGLNTHVRRLFQGGQPSLKLAWAIAAALDCDIEDLLGEGA